MWHWYTIFKVPRRHHVLVFFLAVQVGQEGRPKLPVGPGHIFSSGGSVDGLKPTYFDGRITHFHLGRYRYRPQKLGFCWCCLIAPFSMGLEDVHGFRGVARAPQLQFFQRNWHMYKPKGSYKLNPLVTDPQCQTWCHEKIWNSFCPLRSAQNFTDMQPGR